MVTIPIHEGCSESSGTKSKSSERSSETKDLIIDIIKQDPHITAAEIAKQLNNMSSRRVEKQICKLREIGKIKRTGGILWWLLGNRNIGQRIKVDTYIYHEDTPLVYIRKIAARYRYTYREYQPLYRSLTNGCKLPFTLQISPTTSSPAHRIA